MKLSENPETKKAFAFSLIISIIITLISFIFDMRCGFLTLILSSVLMLCFFISSRKTYKKIENLTDSINKILMGDESINLSDFGEGEISILQSEIHKMTVKLNEQKKLLTEDKSFLLKSLTDISHQLRTPLTSVNLLVSLLAEPDITEEKRSEISNEIFSLLSATDFLLTTLLKISKFDAGTVKLKKEEINLKELIEKAIFPVSVPIELKNQNISIKASGNMTGDFMWTKEALTNIIKNCHEHTPPGGSIEIRAEENPVYSEIIISDTGEGFKDKDINHIFDRFYKINSEGFGVGLSLSKSIITSENGTVKAENGKTGGAVFTIKFYKSGK